MVCVLPATRPAWAQQAESRFGVRYIDPRDVANQPQPVKPLVQQRWFWWVIGGASLLTTAAAVGVGVGLSIKNRVDIPPGYPQQPVSLPFALRVTWGGR